jgi:hypothetical protein
MATPGECLEALLPGLRGKEWRITSPAGKGCNCIAWAAGDATRWWWPAEPLDRYYWPDGVERVVTLAAFIAVFRLLGYEPCETSAHEPGCEKVALFVDPNGLPTHAAREVPGGCWTSKLGNLEDIEHDLNDIAGDIYGAFALCMRRPSATA